MWSNLMALGYPYHCNMSSEYQRPISLLYDGEEPPLIDPNAKIIQQKKERDAKRKALQGKRRVRKSYNYRRRELVKERTFSGKGEGDVEGDENEDIEYWPRKLKHF